MQRRSRRPMEPLPRFPIQRAPASFPILIRRVTAPRPQTRLRHQPALHRIPVHMIQLLNPLLRAPHVEIIKTPLPETPQRFRGCLGPQSHLIRITPSVRRPPQTLRHTLLQDPHHQKACPPSVPKSADVYAPASPRTQPARIDIAPTPHSGSAETHHASAPFPVKADAGNNCT